MTNWKQSWALVLMSVFSFGCADAGNGTSSPGLTAGVTGGGAGGSGGTGGAPLGGASGAAGMIGSGGMGVPTGGAGGAAGAAGAAGTAGGGAGGVGGSPMIGDYVSLAVTPGAALTDADASEPSTPSPAGWKWYSIANTFCRDGSGNGIYVRSTDSDKLLIYFEGGGACTTNGFCNFNPPNVDSVLTGDGQTVLGTALAVGPGRQMPGAYNDGVLDGIFSPDNAANPYKGWNMVYIPYCTGDVHFGSNEAGMVPGLETPKCTSPVQ